MVMTSWASFVRSFRRSQGLTQKEAAELLQVSQPTLSRWESGRQVPDLRTRRKIQQLVETHAGTRVRLLCTSVARSLCAQAAVDRDLRIVAVSPPFARLFGGDPERIKARSLAGPHPLGAEARHVVEAVHRAGIEEGAPVLAECVVETPSVDGRTLFLQELWIPAVMDGRGLHFRVEVAPVPQETYRHRSRVGNRVRLFTLKPGSGEEMSASHPPGERDLADS